MGFLFFFLSVSSASLFIIYLNSQFGNVQKKTKFVVSLNPAVKGLVIFGFNSKKKNKNSSRRDV